MGRRQGERECRTHLVCAIERILVSIVCGFADVDDPNVDATGSLLL